MSQPCIHGTQGDGAKVLTLASIAKRPETLTFDVPGTPALVLRPLLPDDNSRLAWFFELLGPLTKRYYGLSPHSWSEAAERCATIARYDKLRLVAVAGDRIIGLVEFSDKNLTHENDQARSAR